ncbi:hypothetical protein MRB53_041517 [Persea americana]|nr:hypothetical protein MRB53_041517 [Persea americana]
MEEALLFKSLQRLVALRHMMAFVARNDTDFERRFVSGKLLDGGYPGEFSMMACEKSGASLAGYGDGSRLPA